MLAALTVAAAALGASAQAVSQYQEFSLDAVSGDNSVSSHAQLYVVRVHGGYRISGEVTSISGCSSLKAVQMHWGMYVGGDTIAHVCGHDHQVQVQAFTRHSDVVLTADIGMGYDSRIVTLTGTGG